MIGFLAHPFKDFKENVLYFIPVAIGMLLGIGLFSYPIEYLLENYQVFVLWSFAGAIIGTVPSLLKESTRESDRDKIDLVWFWTTFIISGLGLYALNFVVGTLNASFLNLSPSRCTAGSWRIGSWPQPIKPTFDFGTLCSYADRF